MGSADGAVSRALDRSLVGLETEVVVAIHQITSDLLVTDVTSCVVEQVHQLVDGVDQLSFLMKSR